MRTESEFKKQRENLLDSNEIAFKVLLKTESSKINEAVEFSIGAYDPNEPEKSVKVVHFGQQRDNQVISNNIMEPILTHYEFKCNG